MTYNAVQTQLEGFMNQLLHCSDLYELLEQNGSLHQVLAETQLGHHPVLHLIEAAHKALQVRCDGTREFMTAKYIVDELHLEGREHETKPLTLIRHAVKKGAGSVQEEQII